jgi:hypothetical protein
MDAQRLAQLLQMEQNRQAEQAKYFKNLPNSPEDYKPNYQNLLLSADYQPEYQYARGAIADRDRQMAQEQLNQPMQNPGFPPVVAMPQVIPQQNMFGGQVVPMPTTEEKPNFMGGRSVPMPTVGGMGQLSAQEMEYIRSLSR